jgi:hypothetical protein
MDVIERRVDAARRGSHSEVMSEAGQFRLYSTLPGRLPPLQADITPDVPEW